MSEQPTHPKVFLSYSAKDRDTAIRIAEALEKRGVPVWYDLSVPVGDSLGDYISELISASDYLVLLLSPHTMESKWVKYELDAALTKEMAARGITILPVLIADTEIPLFLQGIQFLDCRENIGRGIGRLIDQISAAPEIDFSRLTPEDFENLVAELLDKFNFTNITKARRFLDVGYDIKADYVRTDPFGLTMTETWLVECKFYQQSRASLTTISAFLFYLSMLEPDNYGLLVLNSKLTSVAQEHLAKLKLKTGKAVRVIDGTELKRLLIKHKDLVSKYFVKDEAQANESSE
jgi:hypothetical protein